MRKDENMNLQEAVSLLRQATTVAEVLDRLEEKKAATEATPNVVSLCLHRRQEAE